MDLIEWVVGLFLRVTTLLFSPRPVVEHHGGSLVIRSTWRTTLLTLGAVGRKVTIDPRAQTIKLDARIFWFLHRRRRIECDWIAQVFSTYNDIGVSGWSHVEQDLFCVGLLHKDGPHITLFRFFGQGEFVNMSWLPDWWFVGENALSKVAPHHAEDKAVTVTEILEGALRVPVTNDL